MRWVGADAVRVRANWKLNSPGRQAELVSLHGIYLVKQEPAMNRDNQARLRVAALIYLMVNAVTFGVGLLSVLMTPALVQHAFFWIPATIVTSFVLSAPLAWFIAPLMMMRFILARRVH